MAQEVTGLKINSKEVQEAKINGQIVFRRTLISGPTITLSNLTEEGLLIDPHRIVVRHSRVYTLTITNSSGRVVRTEKGNLSSNQTYTSSFRVNYLADDNYLVTAIDDLGNKTTVNFRISTVNS